jgi:hypothetical protein
VCRESSSFYEDPGLEPRFRNKLDDFKDSGYDRGHMVRIIFTSAPVASFDGVHSQQLHGHRVQNVELDVEQHLPAVDMSNRTVVEQ